MMKRMTRRTFLAATPPALMGLTGCAFMNSLDKEVKQWGPPGTGVVGRNLLKVIKVATTYKASPAQVEAARERAEKIVAARIEEAEAAQIAQVPASALQPTQPETQPEAVAPEPQQEIALTPEEVFETQLLAVEVPQDDRATAATSVIIWDTHSSDFVGEDVYDIPEPVALGQIGSIEDGSGQNRWDTFSAEFVGAGL